MYIINADNEKITKIYQYDSGLYISTEDITTDGYMHFTYTNTEADELSVEIVDEKAPIPNQLLTQSGKLNVYVYIIREDGTKTIKYFLFNVISRPMPPEYVLDPTPVITYPELVELVSDMNALKAVLKNVSASAVTLAPGEAASASAVETEDGLIFIFGLPRGDKGDKGDTGEQGPQGEPGVDGTEGLSMYINDTSTSTTSTVNNMLRSRIEVPDGRTLKIGDLVLLTQNSNLYRVTGFPTNTTVSASKVGTYKVPDGSITEAKLANGAVTNSKLASGAVTNAKIQDATIDGPKLKDSAVYASKIADNAVTNAKIYNGAVSSAKLANGAVAKEKLAAGVVSELEGKTNKPTIISQSAAKIEITDNTEYYLSNISSIEFSYPEDAPHWECYIKLSTAASGTITITFPTSSYIGTAPVFANGETWELSIKDGVVVSGKVVSE